MRMNSEERSLSWAGMHCLSVGLLRKKAGGEPGWWGARLGSIRGQWCRWRSSREPQGAGSEVPGHDVIALGLHDYWRARVMQAEWSPRNAGERRKPEVRERSPWQARGMEGWIGGRRRVCMDGQGSGLLFMQIKPASHTGFSWLSTGLGPRHPQH